LAIGSNVWFSFSLKAAAKIGLFFEIPKFFNTKKDIFEIIVKQKSEK